MTSLIILSLDDPCLKIVEEEDALCKSDPHLSFVGVGVATCGSDPHLRFGCEGAMVLVLTYDFVLSVHLCINFTNNKFKLYSILVYIIILKNLVHSFNSKSRFRIIISY